MLTALWKKKIIIIILIYLSRVMEKGKKIFPLQVHSINGHNNQGYSNCFSNMGSYVASRGLDSCTTTLAQEKGL